MLTVHQCSIYLYLEILTLEQSVFMCSNQPAWNGLAELLWGQCINMDAKERRHNEEWLRKWDLKSNG